MSSILWIWTQNINYHTSASSVSCNLLQLNGRAPIITDGVNWNRYDALSIPNPPNKLYRQICPKSISGDNRAFPLFPPALSKCSYLTLAAVSLALVLTVQTNSLPSRQLWLVSPLLGSHITTGHETINLCQNPLKRSINARCIQSRCFNKGKVVLLTECHGLIGFYRTQMPKIRFVPHKHDYNVGLGMVTEFL